MPAGRPYAVGLTLMLVFMLIGLLLAIGLPRQHAVAGAAEPTGKDSAASVPPPRDPQRSRAQR
jgi:hypothetical protein